MYVNVSIMKKKIDLESATKTMEDKRKSHYKLL